MVATITPLIFSLIVLLTIYFEWYFLKMCVISDHIPNLLIHHKDNLMIKVPSLLTHVHYNHVRMLL